MPQEITDESRCRRHHAEPVPLVVAGRRVQRSGAGRLHERLVARARVWDAPFAPAEVAA